MPSPYNPYILQPIEDGYREDRFYKNPVFIKFQ
jgi:hypothetical protein